MTNRTFQMVSVLTGLCLIASAIPVSSDHFGEPDREAAYIGASWTEHGLNQQWWELCESIFGEGSHCPVIPQGVLWAGCDDESWLGLGLHQGIGGVVFCNVPQDARIGVAVHDSAIDPVTAHVACLEGYDDVHWYVRIGVIEGEGQFDLLEDCPYGARHDDDDEGTTRVAVFNGVPESGSGATAGEVTLNFLD